MLPPEVMRQVRRLQIRARRAVQTLLGGEYHSAFKGTGLSFEEVREYQIGDDIRNIDWNVTARIGNPFIKRYVEERELTLILVLDISGSLRFGSGLQTKGRVAAELAAVLAFCAIANNDRVGLLGFSDRVEKYLPPNKGSWHALRLLREVLFFVPTTRRTDLSMALDYVNKVQARRSILFVLSDFLDGDFIPTFRRTAKKHDLISIRISDPLEQEWPAQGLLRIEDAETREQVLVDTDHPEFRRQFAKSREEQRDAFQSLTRSVNADLIDVSTDGQHFEAMLNFFRGREKRLRRRR